MASAWGSSWYSDGYDNWGGSWGTNPIVETIYGSDYPGNRREFKFDWEKFNKRERRRLEDEEALALLLT